MNLIEIGLVVIEIWGVENGDLAVAVNNTLVCHMSFLAADTWPCVLMWNLYLSLHDNWNWYSKLDRQVRTYSCLNAIHRCAMNIAVVISVGLCVARKHGSFTIYPWQMILWVKSLLHEMIDELTSILFYVRGT